MDTRGHRIILGSNSPRRRELLKGLDIEFVVDPETSFTEFCDPLENHEEIPVHMSRGKSEGFHRPLEDDEILITADTMVLCGKEILGKPHDTEDAKRMLRMLSGREHRVITAVTLRNSQRSETRSDTSNVYFKKLTPEEIDHYVDKYRPLDKAGAYGVQEWIGYVAIERIEGSFYNVMGLPVHKLYEMLKDFIAPQA